MFGGQTKMYIILLLILASFTLSKRAIYGNVELQ